MASSSLRSIFDLPSQGCYSEILACIKNLKPGQGGSDTNRATLNEIFQYYARCKRDHRCCPKPIVMGVDITLEALNDFASSWVLSDAILYGHKTTRVEGISTLANHCQISIVIYMKNLEPGQDSDTNKKNLKIIRWYCDRYAEVHDDITTYDLQRAVINVAIMDLYYLLMSSSEYCGEVIETKGGIQNRFEAAKESVENLPKDDPKNEIIRTSFALYFSFYTYSFLGNPKNAVEFLENAIAELRLMKTLPASTVQKFENLKIIFKSGLHEEVGGKARGGGYVCMSQRIRRTLKDFFHDPIHFSM